MYLECLDWAFPGNDVGCERFDLERAICNWLISNSTEVKGDESVGDKNAIGTILWRHPWVPVYLWDGKHTNSWFDEKNVKSSKSNKYCNSTCIKQQGHFFMSDTLS